MIISENGCLTARTWHSCLQRDIWYHLRCPKVAKISTQVSRYNRNYERLWNYSCKPSGIWKDIWNVIRHFCGQQNQAPVWRTNIQFLWKTGAKNTVSVDDRVDNIWPSYNEAEKVKKLNAILLMSYGTFFGGKEN